jgi:FlgD Ig-like domain/Repeat of unknown function (DUF6923)
MNRQLRTAAMALGLSALAPIVAQAGEPFYCLYVPGPILVSDVDPQTCPGDFVGTVFQTTFELGTIESQVILSMDGAHVSTSRADYVYVNGEVVGQLPGHTSHDCTAYVSMFSEDVTPFVHPGTNTLEVYSGDDNGDYDHFWLRDIRVIGCAPASLLALNDVDQGAGADELLVVDNLSTGIASLVGPLGANYLNTEAMAVIQPTPTFGFVQRLLVIDDDTLVEVDMNTGAGTDVGPIGFSDVDGLAFDPFGGYLYGVTYSGNRLIRIDPNTGAGTLVADDVIPGRHLNDIAFHPNGGRAFVLTETQNEWRVYEIDKATGAKIERWVLSGASSLEALLWSRDGSTLYSAADRNGSKDLVTIDLLDDGSGVGLVSFVSPDPSGFADIEALAWIYPPAPPVLWRLDPTPVTAVSELLPNLDVQSPWPNPFTDVSRLSYAVPGDAGARVEVSVFDVTGRRLRTLVNGHQPSGTYAVAWDGRGAGGRRVTSGVYFYRVTVGNEAVTRRIVMLR